jgi:hypothetical protein
VTALWSSDGTNWTTLTSFLRASPNQWGAVVSTPCRAGRLRRGPASLKYFNMPGTGGPDDMTAPVLADITGTAAMAPRWSTDD